MRICLSAAVFAGISQTVTAADISWNLSGTAAAPWATAANWSPAAVPTSADNAIFSTAAVTTAVTVTLNANQEAAGLSFNNDLAVTLRSDAAAARTLTIGAGGVIVADRVGATAGTITLGATANPLNTPLAAPQTWQVGANRSLAAAGVISGSNLLTKTGTGTLTLSAANTLTGGITLSAGNLILNNAGALGPVDGVFTIAGGALQTTAANGLTIGVAKPIVINASFGYTVPTNGNGNLNLGSGPVTLAASVTASSDAGLLTFSGPVSGDFGFSKSGQGTVAFLGANTYTGDTNLISSGNLRIAGPESIAATRVYLNGGALELGGTMNSVTLGTGNGQVRFNTAGNGGLSVDAGNRQVSITSVDGPNAPLTWGVTPNFIGGGGILILSTAASTGTIDLTNDIDLQGGDRRISVRNGTAAVDAILSGKLTNGRISLQGGGTLEVPNSANVLTGNIAITGGALRVPSLTPVFANTTPILQGGVIEFGSDASLTLGTSPGNVRFAADAGSPPVAQTGGFSAYGGNRTITLNDGAVLKWNGTDATGTPNFLTTATLLLSNGSSDGTTILANGLDFNGAVRTISVANGSAVTDAAVLGKLTNGGLTLSGGGALYLPNETSDYTGVTTASAGTLVLGKLASGGAPSSIGSSANAATNLLLTGGSIRHVGETPSITDRLYTASGSYTLSSMGVGYLSFTNPGAYVNSGTASARTITLSGWNPGANELSGVISDSGTGTSITGITKYGSSNWTLSGNNTLTGNIQVLGGTLVLDYSQNRIPISTGLLTLDNGNVTVKGKNSGATAASVANLRFGSGNLGTYNRFTLDANGGSGIALSVATLTSNTTATNTQNSNLIDLSSSAGNTITVGALAGAGAGAVSVAGNTANPYYVLMANGARNNLIVRTTTGYGFATLSTPTAGTIGALTAAQGVPLDAGEGESGVHYSITTAGTVTRAEGFPLIYATLAIDSTAGAVTLDLAGNTLGNATDNNGRGILVTGSNDVTITGTKPLATGTYSPFMHHYGTGALNFGLGIETGLSLICGGTGFYNFSGAVGAGDTKIYADGSILRFSGSGNLSASTGGLWVGNGGVIEIGMDMNAGAAGDFSNAVGGAAGNLRLAGDSGLSAAGGTRVVNFGGSGATMSWGANYFLTNAGGTTDTDASFKLSSPRSDSTIVIENPIALNNRDRVFDVANGSAADDAQLSGAVSGGGSIIKRGAGTLVFSGFNTYTGDTSVLEGVLRVTQPYFPATSAIKVQSGATLNLTFSGEKSVGAFYIDGVAQPNGPYNAGNTPRITGSGTIRVGPTAGPTPGTYEAWQIENSLTGANSGQSEDFDGDGIKNLVEYAVGSNPKASTGSVLSKTTTQPPVIGFSRSSTKTDLTLVLESSETLVTGSWAAVATSTAGGIVTANVANVVVADPNNPSGQSAVTVTDNRAPAPTKRFYRLRVVK